MRRTRTLQDVKKPAGIGEPDLGVAMFQSFDEDLYVRLAL